MTTEELIKALRDKPSRDNRALLDEAADQLELAQRAIIALTEERRKHYEESCECCACKLLGERDSARAEIVKQDAEIERLKGILESYALQYGTVVSKEFFLKKARAEVVKKFAERLKERTQFYSRKHYENIIDNLVQEFTEGSGNDGRG